MLTEFIAHEEEKLFYFSHKQLGIDKRAEWQFFASSLSSILFFTFQFLDGNKKWKLRETLRDW